MNKRAVISISIVTAILALLLIFFAAVCCVRTETVEFVGDRTITASITNDEIIKTASIKKGSSIFLIDKTKATDRIESSQPYLKVIQIKTTSLVAIEIRVRERVPMYYAKYNTQYIILDEDLKVLEITNDEPAMTELNITNLGINENTKAGDFVGIDYQKSLYNLFTAMYNVGKLNGAYMERDSIKTFMTDIHFDKGYTLTKQYDRLIITTSLGVTLDIAEPECDLEYKVNILMSALDELDETQKSSGTLKYFFTSNDQAKAGYFSAGE